MVDQGFTPRYDYALQSLKDIPYHKWRQCDPRIRCASTPCVCTKRDDQVQSAEDHCQGNGLAILERAKAGVEELKPWGPAASA